MAKDLIDRFLEEGIMRKLEKDEREDVIATSLAVYPPGDKALDLALTLAVIKAFD